MYISLYRKGYRMSVNWASWNIMEIDVRQFLNDSETPNTTKLLINGVGLIYLLGLIFRNQTKKSENV